MVKQFLGKGGASCPGTSSPPWIIEEEKKGRKREEEERRRSERERPHIYPSWQDSNETSPNDHGSCSGQGPRKAG